MADYDAKYMQNSDYDDTQMGGDEYYQDDLDISPEDCWKVIGSFFEKKGLVSMQIDSFDKFMSQTIKELVLDKGSITLDHAKNPDPDEINPVIIERHEVKFLDFTLSYPNVVEGDGVTNDLMPHEARLRSLTYACPAFILMSKKTYWAREQETDANAVKTEGENGTLYWEVGHSDDDIPDDRPESVYIGKIPVMLKSGSCWLNQDSGKTKSSRKIFSDQDLFAWGECPYDQGGYFVINGSEKVLIAQERSAGNIVQIFTKAAPSPFTHLAEMRSVVEGGSRQMSQCTVKLMRKSDGPDGTKIDQPIRVQLPYTKLDVPLAVVFRALDIVSDSDIIEKICFDHSDKEMIDMLMGTLQEGQAIQRGEHARSFIAVRTGNEKLTPPQRQQITNDILQKEWLPHIGKGPDALTKKAYYLGYMVNRLLKCALGRTEPDDRDHLGKKRLDLAGPLMTTLFRTLFDRATKDFFRYMQKRVESDQPINIRAGFKPNIITNGLKYSLATGNWGDQKKLDKAKAGVSQVLNRYAYASTVSHLRRTNAPIGREGKIAKPRQLHNTHWGYVCPAETPEGQACGLVKNLALMTLVTNDVPIGPLRDYILEKDVEALEDWEPKLNPQATKVFLNGVWFGVIVRDPRFLVDHMKQLRRSCVIDSTIGLVWDIREKEFRITGEGGRIIRPLFTIDNDRTSLNNGNLTLSKYQIARLEATQQARDSGDVPPDEPCDWETLLREGAVEYLDAEEEETAMIVMTPEHLNDSKTRDQGGEIETSDDPLARHDPLLTDTHTQFTHCEIHPSMILGVCASIIPFPDHNQSPRNTYQSAMGKQAMGVFLTNFERRMETMANILYYPQKPLARTMAMEYLKFRELPAGQNAIVAIACYSGYNQEDSVVMNQSSIDRGLFRSLFYRTYQEQERVVGQGVFEAFEKPTRADTLRMKHGTYEKLDQDGIIVPGVRVSGEDIIMGKTTPMAPDAEELGQRQKAHIKRDVSVPLRSTESGVIDQVMVTTTSDGNRFAKVRVRTTKVPQIGDKFASRHGQKGTIGVTYRTEDMPFSRDGIVPDLIINPHAIPSRMTIAHLVECQLSKVATLRGDEGDATPFTKVTVTQVSRILREQGYQSRGFEVMYNGHTGRKLMAQVFFGPTYYQRLRHMVDDKIHSRARGPTQILTRQPVEGRARDGGLRFGEMERDCMIAHGASSFLKERLFDVSDPFRVHVCDICGLMTVVAKLKKNTFECKNCNNKNQISQVYLPYAAKLLFQELWAMNIAARLYTRKSK
ncbi:uncharacterized protein HMPREF1541_01028 [Cyphellophora europaea CBS 101466]|uniref:DNA-directed RNA polymerase subunit beta n=1 Tax=Cyphellophora europaea (strain CBS 101466) TaxID=1220924 RepID=W2SG24_CYPE1|nr:uncharacterized protein HMPREF1541_01028 [Cyphellophora europaea CBS 101466]ETN46839.1 hypothetical protein HMPREF1541_01028 [Cyphellophora europaea CBS 101466]